MPIGRKLDIQVPVILDMAQMQAWFKEYDSRCEAPECAADRQPAYCWYQTIWSFVWLCRPCFVGTMLRKGDKATAWDRKLAEYRYEQLLVRSYTHQNTKSNFRLEDLMAEREATQRALKKAEVTSRASEVREVRKAIRESDVKIGSPDDSILLARQRQDERERAGQHRFGPARGTSTKLLRAKLIIPTARIIAAGNDKTEEVK